MDQRKGKRARALFSASFKKAHKRADEREKSAHVERLAQALLVAKRAQTRRSETRAAKVVKVTIFVVGSRIAKETIIVKSSKRSKSINDCAK